MGRSLLESSLYYHTGYASKLPDIWVDRLLSPLAVDQVHAVWRDRLPVSVSHGGQLSRTEFSRSCSVG